LKKRILFVSYSMNIGGIQKSLLSLLSCIDYSKYDIDVMFFNREGELLNYIPKEINIIDPPDYISFMLIPKKQILKSLKNLANKPFALLLYIVMMFKGFIIGNMNMARQKYWKIYSKKLPGFNKKYDVAVAFHGGIDAYFVADKINANKKICWVHSDYNVLRRDKKIDKYYLDKFNTIVAVSETCRQKLLENHPHLQGKSEVIHNIVSKKQILQLAQNGKGFTDNYDGTRLLDVSRLDPMKGFDIAIPVIARLKTEGYNIRYYIVGDGPEKNNIQKDIKRYGLEDDVILLGKTPNPYPFIYQSDIFVHPSRFEGKSVAIDEAMLLGKPVIIMNYQTAKDQMIDGKTGFIAEMSEDGLYQKLKLLLDNKLLRNAICENLRDIQSNEAQNVMKFYRVIGDV
jgi:glycosyltransferase involved in cell wall biosynthesis